MSSAPVAPLTELRGWGRTISARRYVHFPTTPAATEAGYSLGMPFKGTAANRERLRALAGDFDRLVAAGGRWYFAKDSTTMPPIVRQFMGAEQLARFRQLKEQDDSDQLLQTDLFRRLLHPAAASVGPPVGPRSAVGA